MSCEEGHCITCSDEGVEVAVLAVAGETALCRAADGGEEEVDVTLLDAVAPGDVLLAHARVALARLGRAEAAA